jgi:hypothetical protein
MSFKLYILCLSSNAFQNIHLVLVVGRVVEVELGRAGRVHHDVEEAELAGGEGADHDAPRAQALRAQRHDAGLRSGSEPQTHSLVNRPYCRKPVWCSYLFS